MSSTKRGLGGGLSNLFGGDVTDLSAAGAAAGGVTQLSLSRIEPNPNQPHTDHRARRGEERLLPDHSR